MSELGRRKHRRVDIQLPLEYVVKGEEATAGCRTTTRNCSTGGVYFEVEGPPPKEGQRLDLDLIVPPGIYLSHKSRITGAAEVTRVTPLLVDKACRDQTGRFGIAAKVEGWVTSFSNEALP